MDKAPHGLFHCHPKAMPSDFDWAETVMVTATEALNKIRFALLCMVARVCYQGGSLGAQLKKSCCDEQETLKWGSVCRFSQQCLRR